MASHGLRSGVPVYTQCQLQNHAGGDYYVKLDIQNSWHGAGDPPKTIQDQNPGNYRHNSDAVGSIAGVSYILVVNDVDTLKWVTAWRNQEGLPNKVYTVILPANTTVDWNQIKTDLENSGNQSSDLNKYGYSAQVTIDQQSPTPELIAKLKKAE